MPHPFGVSSQGRGLFPWPTEPRAVMAAHRALPGHGPALRAVGFPSGSRPHHALRLLGGFRDPFGQLLASAPVTRQAVRLLCGLALTTALGVASAGVGGTGPTTANGRTASLGDGAAPIVYGHRLRYRWVYLPDNYQAAGNVERMMALLDRAKAAGYNGALLADVKFGRLDDGSLVPAYYTNLRTVLEHARKLGMDMIPATADFGYSESILWHDPNLAEGLPVRGALFQASDGALVPLNDPPVTLVNGDFEQLPADGHQFPGWAWQDQPGVTTFVDTEVKHGGRASLRMTDIGLTNPPHGHGRIHQRVRVQPFHYYHVSVWLKTEEFHGGDVWVMILGQKPQRTLQYNPIPIEPTRDWWRFDVTFNSLTHDEILFYFGVWGGGRGTIWWDDGAMEPAGFVNVVRRAGAPLRMTSADGLTVYEEGRDYEAVVDLQLGRVPWRGLYDLWHDPPRIGLPAGSRIADGQVVRASYYHMATIYGHQVPASLTEPRSFEICRGQLSSLQREFSQAGAFAGWLFGHDEIRVHGWDEAPRAGAGSPGEDLAYNFRTLYDMAKAMQPGAVILTWSDMFDPYHNATDSEDPYYLVNGSWAGSWLGLPADVIVLNWHHHRDRRLAAEFFAERGHRQILAGYYDASPDQFGDRDWLRELEGVPRIEGVMYTAWGSGYDNLEAWAHHAWGDAPWTTTGPARDVYLPVLCRGMW